MNLTTEQLWQEAFKRLMLIDIEKPISESTVDDFLAGLPKRLAEENYLEWIRRGQKLAKVIAFPKVNFRYLTDVQRLAADSREMEDALPEKPLISDNKKFKLTIKELINNKLKLKLEALSISSSKYAHQLIGIAAENSKEGLISLIYLDEDGEGIDESLDNTPAIRQALLRPVIALVEQDDA